MLNRYPLWKYLLILAVIVLGFIYAAPNLYVPDSSVQISGVNSTVPVDDKTIATIENVLKTNNIAYLRAEHDQHSALLRFTSTDTQLKAKDVIQQALGENYLVALNLAASTPKWLRDIGAMPMKLGLDLRGGVNFLMQVDVDSVVKQRVEGDLANISQTLRAEHIRYSEINRVDANNVVLQFRSEDTLNDAYSLLSQRFPEFSWKKSNLTLQATLVPAALLQIKQETLEQSMNTLRHRVNELGVSEAVVMQQGESRVSVDLPGIQDTTLAKDIIGKTATLEFHLVDMDHDPNSSFAPSDTKVYEYEGRPYLLKNEIILRGSSITSASSGFSDDGRSSVNVRLGGGGESLFTETTAKNIGKPMAVVYVDVKSDVKTVDGKKIISYQTNRRVISVATIQSALGNSFQITGLMNAEEARNLALLLRAGALPATVSFLEERQVGPSLGKQNIHMGVLSVEVGFVLVVVFMALYYGVMGIFADLALGMNLILIVAVLSILGATLTLPGIAGIVLTMGMAVDANVLIFERIREELRNGMGVQSSIFAGYDRALITIIDANMTTLIVAIVLFSLGSGTVKAFAVTLTIGLITSMFTAITGTRALVNGLYGSRNVKKISIGI